MHAAEACLSLPCSNLCVALHQAKINWPPSRRNGLPLSNMAHEKTSCLDCQGVRVNNGCKASQNPRCGGPAQTGTRNLSDGLLFQRAEAASSFQPFATCWSNLDTLKSHQYWRGVRNSVPRHFQMRNYNGIQSVTQQVRHGITLTSVLAVQRPSLQAIADGPRHSTDAQPSE